MTVWVDEYVAGLEAQLEKARAETAVLARPEAERLAKAWDECAEFAIGYSVALLYENPYRADVGLTE